MHTEVDGREKKPQEQPVTWVKISNGLRKILCIQNIFLRKSLQVVLLKQFWNSKKLFFYNELRYNGP